MIKDCLELPQSEDWLYPRRLSAVQCSAIQYNTVKCSAIQCNTVQCRVMQGNAVKCSALVYPAWFQFNTMYSFLNLNVRELQCC